MGSEATDIAEVRQSANGRKAYSAPSIVYEASEREAFEVLTRIVGNPAEDLDTPRRKPQFFEPTRLG